MIECVKRAITLQTSYCFCLGAFSGKSNIRVAFVSLQMYHTSDYSVCELMQLRNSKRKEGLNMKQET